MADRGEYRAIRRVLLDGPDFQQLSERARFVFLTLKVNIGPTGIEVHYPVALAHQVAAQTGMPADGALGAFEELRAGGWIQIEANVIWIVGQLEHDPHMAPKDGKHRKSVQRHVAGLPRLDIVRRFVEAHPDWFADAEDMPHFEPAKPLGRPSEGPTKAPGSTEDREPKTEDRVPRTDGEDAPDEPAPTKSAKRWRFVPSGWRPTADHAALATELGVDLQAETQKFRDHEFGTPKSDPDRAFSGWLRRSREFQQRSGTPPPGMTTADARILRHRQQLEQVDLNGSRSVFDGD